jgi:LIVCS family branched-chain amino acid:cation transporter
VDPLLDAVGNVLPFFGLGMGWICPALAGLVIGLIWKAVRK